MKQILKRFSNVIFLIKDRYQFTERNFIWINLNYNNNNNIPYL